MPSVIDSLTLNLTLDPSKFVAGQQQALQSLKTTKEAALKTGAEVESSSKKLLEQFSDFKRVALGIAGIFIGGMGIKELTSFIVNLDAATARTAKTMDISTHELAKWQGAALQTGGSAEGMTGTLQSLSSEMNKFLLTGQSGLLSVLGPLGVSLTGANGQLKTSTELFLDLADAVQGMDPARARAFLSLVGMDQNAINLAIEGRRALQGYLEAAERAGVATEESGEKAKKYQEQLALLGIAANNTQRALIMNPIISHALLVILAVLQHMADPEIWSAISNGFSIAFGLGVAKVHETIAALYEADAAFSDFFGATETATKDRLKAAGWRSSAQQWRSSAAPDASHRAQALSDQTSAGAAPGYNNSVKDVRQKIVERAIAWGIDPATAVTVAEHEGLHNYQSTIPGEDSVGPFQLHYGGGLGDTFTQETGLDAHDPSTLDAQINWVMAHLRKTGWGPYHGAKAAGIGNRQGIGTPPPIGATAGRYRQSDLGGSGNAKTVSVETGDIHIHGVKDAADGADKFASALQRAASVAFMNGGLA